MPCFRTDTDHEGVMTITFDAPGKSVNTFTPEAMEELNRLLDSIEGMAKKPVGVVFASGKSGAFIAGADLFAMQAMDENAMRAFLQRGQQVFDRIAKLPVPTVAAINGNCLGGGCELALACDYRVAVDDGSIAIGLPEVKLGIIPAWGGTTRMSRMFGLTKALPFLLGGKTVPPRRARSVRLIDDCVRPEALADAARRYIRTKPPTPRPGFSDRVIAIIGPLTDFVINRAGDVASRETYGNYPAPDKLLDAAQTAVKRGHAAGLEAEREAVIELARGGVCRNLMRVFFLRQGAKKAVREKLRAEPRPVKQVAVIGGGTMGAGIVAALVRAGIGVRLIDISPDAISAALNRINADLQADVKAKRLSPLEAKQAMHRVSPSTEWTGLKLVDFAIEAVSERPQIKLDVFAKLDEHTRDDCVLASNTSSLDITSFAAGTKRPERMIGLHFFNPVSKMPLVEVIRAGRSSDAALATGLDLALRIGKTPVLVNDAPGFLVNRVLFPYLAEAMMLAGEGVPIDAVDAAMRRWGMPMGPFELLDQVGLDVAADIFASVSDRLGEHLPRPRGLDGVIARGWLGRKSGKGFYDYSRKKPAVNAELVAMLRGRDGSTPAAAGDVAPNPPAPDDSAIYWRCVLPMVNEAARLLRERVTDSTETVDLATVMGLGLAPFRGGLCRFADEAGLNAIVSRMDELTARHGTRFAPVDDLRRAAVAEKPMQSIADAAAARQSSERARNTESPAPHEGASHASTEQA